MADQADGTDANRAEQARELAERLADVHRRTAELAARVANFQAATTELADSVGADSAGSPEPTDSSDSTEPSQTTDSRESAASTQPGEPEDSGEPDDSGGPPAVGGVAAGPKRRPSPVTRREEAPDEAPADAAAGQGGDDHASGGPAAQPPPKRPRPGTAPAAEANNGAPRDQKPADAGPKASRTDDKSAEDTPSKKRSRRGMPKWVRTARSLLIAAVVVVAAAWALRTWVASPYYVPSASMEPTLHGCPNCDNDHVLVQKLSYDFHDPERGDIVVFENPGGRWGEVPDKDLIKRVIGVPGDHISVLHRHVYINGAEQAEPYVNKSCHGTAAMGLRNGYRVPKGEIFVMGDNRCDSEDSRMFGPVPIDKVIGKAMLIFWPLGRFGSP